MTRINEWLGTALPLIQAPMAGVQGHAVAAAVCEAGGLGSLPCATLGVEAMVQELHAMRARTQRPFNVNFFCHTNPAPDAQQDHTWRRALQPYFDALGIDDPVIASGPARLPFSQAVADAVAPFRPRVVSFHFGLPDAQLLAQVKSWGAVVLSSATTVDEALWLQAHGADAIIAQGLEAGGHRGMFLSDDLTQQLGTWALLPQIVDAVRLPVIAAGGIADARGVAAAMAMGAAGVQVGTAYLLCDEAQTSPLHRAALQSAGAAHTALTRLFTGRPARGIMNRLMRELGPLNPVAPAFPLAANALAPLRALAESGGCDDFTPLWAGQNVRGCRATSAADITQSLAAGFSRTTVCAH